MFLFIGTTELIAIGAVILLLFGGKKIPELMRSLGAGVNSFKQGMAEGADPKKEETKASSSAEKEDKK